ncbi:MAG: DUF1131 family protein [Rhodocyclaceae bacterium]|jgi:hypothetical protein|nr:DUF1131 family protein [Rhodocyclaceae bacterium]
MKPVAIFLCALLALASFAQQAFAAELSVSDKGVGPISASTRFNRNDLQKALPQFVVKVGERSTEGEVFRVLLISDASGLLATVNPGEGEKGIFSIRITSRNVRNALGPKLGATYLSVFGTGVATPDCTPGQEEMSGKVICPHPGSRHVSYIFAGKSSGPDGTLPPPAVLKNFAIEEIVWLP